METIDDLRAALHTYPPAQPNVAGVIARGRRRRTARRVMGGVAVAVAAAVAAPVVTAQTHQRDDAASTGVGAAPADEAFMYHRVIGTYGKGAAERCGYVHEAWYAFDEKQPGRLVEVDGINLPAAGWTGDPTTLTTQPGCKRKIQQSDKYMQGTVGMPNVPPDAGDWSAPNARFVAALPSTAEGILQLATDASLRNANAADLKRLNDPKLHLKDAYAFHALISLLSSEYPQVTAQVRRNALDALLLVPGVRKFGATKDMLGRPGIAVAEPVNGNQSRPETQKYILDAQTGEFLGQTGDYGTAVSTSTTVPNTTVRPTN